MSKVLSIMMAFGVSGVVVADDPWLVFPGGDGPGKGKHVVLISGDEEYRSEEALPMLGRMLAERQGFKCTVLFAIDKESGEINPNEQGNIPGLEALETADVMVLGLRFRGLPDEQMKFIADYLESGKPIIGLRTSTHAFKFGKDSKYAKWSFNSKQWPGGFGRQVLGETWINHHGHHGKESTRGVVAKGAADHPLLRGVKDVWGPTDVYGITKLPADAKVLLDGQVLTGMKPDDGPVEGKKNDPMMPVAWIRARPMENGRSQMVVCTTMGAATDFVAPGLRRLVANSVFHACGLEVPAEMNVGIVGDYQPSEFGFDKGKKGLKPGDFK